MRVNTNFANLQDSYLFAEIGQRVKNFLAANPGRHVIRMGIGDVTRPLVPTVVAAMENAAREMGRGETFRGYGDAYGYDFLRQAILRGYGHCAGIGLDDIFVSDGAKCDAANILDIFGAGNTAIIPDPVYPVYLDTSIMAGNEIVFAPGRVENDFLPMPDANQRADIIYICSPNNPTGAVYSAAQLQAWVDYALAQDAVILYDSAYEAFIRDGSPTSIFQIKGAEKCAIEICSLSKTAGFTGVRCGWAIVPQGLVRGGVSLNKMWARRQATKFNGVSYIVQRGAEAALSPEGLAQNMANVDYYLENAGLIAGALSDMGIWYAGGRNAPYVWLKCPEGLSSWEFFDLLLNNANVVGTPGAGFGAMGEGFFRLSAFGSRENTAAAMGQIRDVLEMR